MRRRGGSCGFRHGVGERLEIDRQARGVATLVLEHAEVPQHYLGGAVERRNLHVGDMVAIGAEQPGDDPGSRLGERHGLSSTCKTWPAFRRLHSRKIRGHCQRAHETKSTQMRMCRCAYFAGACMRSIIFWRTCGSFCAISRMVVYSSTDRP